MSPPLVDPACDMPLHIILGTPGAFDFQAFSDATRRSLALLAPLMDLRHINSKVTNDIVAQIVAFGQAIQSGATTAQKGFTATEDIIALAEMVNQTTSEERAEYLNGTLELADSAYSQGKDAFDSLRDVRQKIFTLSDKFDSMIQKPKTADLFQTKAQEEAARRSFEELKKGIEVLESSGRQVSELARWWDWVKVETDSYNGQKAVTFDDSSLKQAAVVDRWKLLRSQFADYTNMVRQLEDEYPEFLSGNAVTHPSPQAEKPPVSSKLARPDLPQATKSRPVRHSSDPSKAAKKAMDKEKISPDQRAGHAGKSGRANGEIRRKEKTVASTVSSVSAKLPQREAVPYSLTSQSEPYIKKCPRVVFDLQALIDKYCYDSSYISARLSNVQILEEGVCLLVVQFQCHPSPRQRFTTLQIKWRFASCDSHGPPSLQDVAPKDCVWDKTAVKKDREFGVNIPLQVTLGSIVLGPQIDQQWKTQTTIQRGTTFMGSTRGARRDAAEWTVEENASAMSGVPPHFCIAAVVSYEVPFLMEMEISAIQRRTSNVLAVSKIDQAKSESMLVEVEKLQHRLPDYKPADGWREWFPEISGEVRGGGIRLNKVAFRR